MAFGIAGPKAPAGRYGEPVIPNLNVRHLCPNCRSDPPNIIEEYSKGDLVCADCGTILGDRIVDTRSEWRTFAGDEGGDDPSRVGDAGNPLLGGDLSTVISSRDGRTGLSRELQRAQARSNAQRNSGRTTTAKMEGIFAQITEKCNVLGIPGIAQRAQHAYMIVDEHRQIKAREEATYVAACISFATRGVPDADRTLTEVCKAVGLSKKVLGKALIAIKPLIQGKLTALKGGVQDTSGVASMTSSVDGLLGRYVNRLALGNAAHNIAKQISTINSAKGWTEGRSYQSVASGIVFYVITLMELKGEGANLKDLGIVSGTSETTIKLVRKLLAARSSELVRPEWQEQYARGYRELYRIGETANPDLVEGDETASNAGTDMAETPRDAPTPVANGSANGNGSGHSNGNARAKTKRPPSPLGQNTVLPTPTAA